MERITLHVPETLGDGSPVPPEQLEVYEDELHEIALAAKISAGFGNEGFAIVYVTGAWRSPLGKTYREPIIRYEIDVADAQTVVDRVLQLGHRIRADLTQESVYVTVSPIDAVTVTEYVPA